MFLSGRTAAVTLLSLGLIVGISVPILACAGQTSNPLISAGAHLGYTIGSIVCHQRPERSFISCGRQWPVCGRCAGLYMGFALGTMLVFARPGRTRPQSDSSLDSARLWRRALTGAAIPTAALWILEFVVGINPGTLIRWIGAIPLGVVTAFWLGAVRRGDLR